WMLRARDSSSRCSSRVIEATSIIWRVEPVLQGAIPAPCVAGAAPPVAPREGILYARRPGRTVELRFDASRNRIRAGAPFLRRPSDGLRCGTGGGRCIGRGCADAVARQRIRARFRVSHSLVDGSCAAMARRDLLPALGRRCELRVRRTALYFLPAGVLAAGRRTRQRTAVESGSRRVRLADAGDRRSLDVRAGAGAATAGCGDACRDSIRGEPLPPGDRVLPERL